jgi:hypothetical protein
MGRKANWPPKVIPHRPSGRDRVRWKGVDHYLGPIGSPESRANYVELIRKLAQERAVEDDPASLTVASLIALWHVHAAAECDPREVENYRHALRPRASMLSSPSRRHARRGRKRGVGRRTPSRPLWLADLFARTGFPEKRPAARAITPDGPQPPPSLLLGISREFAGLTLRRGPPFDV